MSVRKTPKFWEVGMGIVTMIIVPVVHRLVLITAVFLFWPFIPALLWNWSAEPAAWSSVAEQISSRLDWMIGTHAVHVAITLLFVVGIGFRAAKLIQTAPRS